MVIVCVVMLVFCLLYILMVMMPYIGCRHFKTTTQITTITTLHHYNITTLHHHNIEKSLQQMLCGLVKDGLS